MVIVAVEPLLLVFPWPCCSTSHWAGRQRAQPPPGLLGDFEGFFFPAMEKAKHILRVRAFSSSGMAAMAALCLVVPHIWAQLPTMLR